MDRIEVITSVERRRKHSLAEKKRLAMAAAAPGARVVEIARAAGVDPSLLYRWRRALSAPLISREPDTRGAPTFVPVTIAPSTPAPAPMPESESMITVEFAGGARVKIEGAPDAKILASVISALSKAER